MENKEQKRKELIADINEYLFPRWYKPNDRFNPMRKEYWNELIEKLYHCKALNLFGLYEQIEFQKSKRYGNGN